MPAYESYRLSPSYLVTTKLAHSLAATGARARNGTWLPGEHVREGMLKVLGLALVVLVGLGCDVRAAQRHEVVLREDVVLVLETKPFEEADHKIILCGGIPCLIDRAPIYGAYGSLPAVEIESLFVRVGEREIPLEHSGMYNPWSPREDRDVDVWLLEEPGGRLLIRGRFSDGASVYVAEWEIIGDVSMRTILKCLECLGLSCSDFASGG